MGNKINYCIERNNKINIREVVKMGLIANYQYLSDENLKELKEFSGSEDDLMEQVEEWNEEADILLDIDKMWDVLHFVLTGVDSSEPMKMTL